MALVRVGETGVDMTVALIGPSDFLTYTERGPTIAAGDYRVNGRGDYSIRIEGVNLGAAPANGPGLINRVTDSVNGRVLFEVTDFSAEAVFAPFLGPAQSREFAQRFVLSGDDTVEGGAGNDTLRAFGGRNVIRGGAGNDTAVIDVSSAAALSYRFRDEAAVFRTAGRQADLLVGIENVRFTNTTVPQISLPAAQPLQYIASYADLTARFGADEVAGWRHFAQTGLAEGRTVGFSGLRYIASYNDLRVTFGTDAEAGARHFLSSGRVEGRAATFDGLRYIASHGDLIRILPKTVDAGAMHFIAFGANENRGVTFDPLRYIASHRDLIRAYGANEARGIEHWLSTGFAEQRSAAVFNPAQYLANYADLRAAFGTDLRAATLHYVQIGAAENRVFTPLA